MAYRILADERIPQSIKRVISEELTSAVEQLSKPQDREKAVHEARKSIKKVRGALRLVQTAIGETYRIENRELRDVGRSLSEFRDQVAMIEVFDQMAKWFEGRKGRRKPVTEEFASIRGGLDKQKTAQERSAKLVDVANEGVRVLRAVSERLSHSGFSGDGLDIIQAGLKKRYGRGRKAMKRAAKNPDPEQYHAFRKAVKDQWYHVRLLGEVFSTPLDEREKALKDLETSLGDDHNLAVLGDRLRHNPAQFGKTATAKAFLRVIAEYQNHLRARADEIGRRLFKSKPGKFTQKMRNNWRDEWVKHQRGAIRQEKSSTQPRSPVHAVA